MAASRAIAGIAALALTMVGVAVAPAFGAGERVIHLARHAVPVPARAALGGFTPVAADPRLAAIFARGGLDSTGFRFTPADSLRSSRAVTVAVRARSNAAVRNAAVANNGNAGLTPVAYNLGAAIGWKRFAVSGDVAHIDMAGQPGSREAADVALSYNRGRFVGQLKAATDRPLAGTPALVENPQSYSVDVGGSYSLTRRIDLTAGLRYRSEREQRLTPVDDNRRDSQAVYLGTAFRF